VTAGSHTGSGSTLAPEPKVSVLLLGPVDLRNGDVSVPIGGAKVRAVLAQLALADGQVVPAEQLIDGVWGEQSPVTAANTLQYHVGVLRKALAAAGLRDGVATRPPGYALTMPTDLRTFRQHRRAGEEAARARHYGDAADAFAAALACWRGPALGDLLTYPFAGSRAVALEEERLRCVESWVDAELGQGRGAELVPALEQLVGEHGTRERLWEQLMVALYRGGRQADALAAFARARDLLDEELGLEPSPALQEVQARVLSHDPRLMPEAKARPVLAAGIAAGATRLRSSLPTKQGWLVRPDGSRYELGPHPVVLGRQDSCGLVLVDEEVSRRHAQVVSTGDGHAVEDVGSTNGTHVNGNRITVLTRLAHGDRLEVGGTVLRYESDAV
jgi:DNA-binding SARP family transcriptional activator